MRPHMDGKSRGHRSHMMSFVARLLAALLVGAAGIAPVLAAAQHAAHTHPDAGETRAPVPASVDVPLDASAFAPLQRSKVEADAHGQALRCEGVALVALLRHSGAMPAAPLRGGDQLARRVEVVARDGYRVTFSLGELDPSLGNRQVFVVDRCDGKPLADGTGPLRLLVPEDSRPARGIRQIERITVLSP